MLYRRIGQFLVVYCLGIALLLLMKYALRLSDYVIPAPAELWHAAVTFFPAYIADVLDTLRVAILGQVLSLCLALGIGIAGRRTTWFGSLVKAAAYNVQAYPIVALAPIIFILLGDGFISRLLIAAMICYFPLLLSIIGIMSEPVIDVEHFYVMTGKMRWQLEVKIRAFENLHKLTTVIAGSATWRWPVPLSPNLLPPTPVSGTAFELRFIKVILPRFLLHSFLSAYRFRSIRDSWKGWEHG